MAEFYQTGPVLENQYGDDAFLQSYLKRTLPADIFAQAEPELDRLGARAVGDLLDLSQKAECEEPVHIPFDAWGRRIDELRVSDAWRRITDVAAEEGIVATAYERKFGPHSRLVQFAKLYLF